jgi:flagellar basal body rod protein FlgF
MDTLSKEQLNQTTNPSDTQENTLVHLKVQAADALTNCVSQIQILLNKSGISAPPAIELTLTLDGYIQVKTRQHDHKTIEMILNRSDRIIEGLKEVEVLHRMLHGLTFVHSHTEIFHLGLTSLGGIVFFTSSPVAG